MNLKRLGQGLLLLAAACAIHGCGKKSSSDPAAPPGPPTSGGLQSGFGDTGAGIIQLNLDPGPDDWFNDAVIDPVGGFMYTVGGIGDGMGTNYFWRIEKRLLSTGMVIYNINLDPSFTANLEKAMAIAIDVPGNVMYVIGTEFNAGTGIDWRVAKRFLNNGTADFSFGTGGTGYETIIPSAGDDLPTAIAIDGTHLYAVGMDEQLGSSDTRWRIEKRALSDGAVDSGFGTSGVQISNPSAGADEPEDMKVDGTWMYVVGTSTTGGGSDVQWHIEKRALLDGAGDTGFDGDGIRSINHAVGAGADDELRSIAIDTAGGFMYLAGDDSTLGGFNRQWRVEKRLLSDGTLVGGFAAGGALLINPGSSFDFAVGVFLDGANLYVSGLHHIDPPLPNQDLRIEILKCDAATGAAITTFGTAGLVTENPTGLVDGIAVFGADATHVYLGGVENADVVNDPPLSDVGWRIEKRLK